MRIFYLHIFSLLLLICLSDNSSADNHVGLNLKLAKGDNGSLYVFGDIADTLFFPSGDTLLYYDSTYSIHGSFLLKLDSNGNKLWLRTIRSGGLENQKICSDKYGNIFISSKYYRVLIYDDSIHGITTATNALFLIKINSEGNCVWMMQGAAYNNNLNDIAADSSGNIFMYGNFVDAKIKFSNNISLSTPSGQITTGFILKCDSNGSGLWIKKLYGYSGYDFSVMNVAKDGTSYLSGLYGGNLGGAFFFESLQLTNTPNAPSSVFIAKCASDGSPQWLIGSNGMEQSDPAVDLIIDDTNNVIVTGQLWGRLYFGNLPIMGTTTQDGYSCKINADGIPVWSTQYLSPDAVNYLKLVGTGFAQPNLFVIGGNARDSLRFPPTKNIYCDYPNEGFILVKNNSNDNQSLVNTRTITNLTTNGNDAIWTSHYTIRYYFRPEDTIYINKWDAQLNKVWSYSIYNPVHWNGLKETMDLQNTLVYPNPLTNQITIELKNNAKVETIDVFDNNGMIIHTPILKTSIAKYVIQFDELSAGFYYLKLTTDKGVLYKKLMKSY